MPLDLQEPLQIPVDLPVGSFVIAGNKSQVVVVVVVVEVVVGVWE